MNFRSALDSIEAERAASVAANPAPPPASSFAERAFGDTSMSIIKGAAQIPNIALGLADIVSGGRAGKAAADLGYDSQAAGKFYDQFLTPEARAAQEKVSKADGFFNTVGAALENPSTIVNAVAESLPTMLVGGQLGRGVAALAPKTAKMFYPGGFGGVMKRAAGGGESILAPSAGAIGEALVGAGTAAEQIRASSEDGYLSPKQAALAAAGGAATGIVNRASAGVSKGLGIEDVDQLFAGQTTKTAGKALKAPARVGLGILTEGGEELAQAPGETITQNLAEGKKWDEGLGNNAAMSFLAGAAMGAGANIRGAARDALAAIPTPAPTGTSAAEQVMAGTIDPATLEPVTQAPVGGYNNNLPAAPDQPVMPRDIPEAGPNARALFDAMPNATAADPRQDVIDSNIAGMSTSDLEAAARQVTDPVVRTSVEAELQRRAAPAENIIQLTAEDKVNYDPNLIELTEADIKQEPAPVSPPHWSELHPAGTQIGRETIDRREAVRTVIGVPRWDELRAEVTAEAPSAPFAAIQHEVIRRAEEEAGQPTQGGDPNGQVQGRGQEEVIPPWSDLGHDLTNEERARMVDARNAPNDAWASAVQEASTVNREQGLGASDNAIRREAIRIYEAAQTQLPPAPPQAWWSNNQPLSTEEGARYRQLAQNKDQNEVENHLIDMQEEATAEGVPSLPPTDPAVQRELIRRAEAAGFDTTPAAATQLPAGMALNENAQMGSTFDQDFGGGPTPATPAWLSNDAQLTPDEINAIANYSHIDPVAFTTAAAEVRAEIPASITPTLETGSASTREVLRRLGGTGQLLSNVVAAAPIPTPAVTDRFAEDILRVNNPSMGNDTFNAAIALLEENEHLEANGTNVAALQADNGPASFARRVANFLSNLTRPEKNSPLARALAQLTGVLNWLNSPANAQLLGILENGTAMEVLDHLAANSANQGHRDIATMLKEYFSTNTQPTIQVTNSTTIPGAYQRGPHNIKISRVKATEQTILHELVHAATVQRISANNSTGRALKNSIKRMMQHVVTQNPGVDLSHYYGFQFTDGSAITDAMALEFLAEAMTRREFQELLASTPAAANTPHISIWTQLLRAVSRALGLTSDNRTLTALDEVLSLGTQAMGRTGTAQNFSTPTRDQVMGTAVGQELRTMAEQAGTAEDFAQSIYGQTIRDNNYSVSRDIITGNIGERISRVNGWSRGDVAGVISRLTSIQDTGVASIQEFYESYNPRAAAAATLAREQAAVAQQAEAERLAEATRRAQMVMDQLRGNDPAAVDVTRADQLEVRRLSGILQPILQAASSTDPTWASMNEAFKNIWRAIGRKIVPRWPSVNPATNTVREILAELNTGFENHPDPARRNIRVGIVFNHTDGTRTSGTAIDNFNNMRGSVSMQYSTDGGASFHPAILMSIGGGASATNRGRTAQMGALGYYMGHLFAKQVPGASFSSGGMWAVNQLRRVEIMLSFMLRNDIDSTNPSANIAVNTQSDSGHGSFPERGAFRAGQSNQHIRAGIASLLGHYHIYPQLVNFHFDFEHNRIIYTPTGRVVPPMEIVSVIRAGAGLDGRSSGYTRVEYLTGAAPMSQAETGGDNRAIPAGVSVTTIRRAVMTQTMLRDMTSPNADVAAVSNQLVDEISNHNGTYENLLYHQGEALEHEMQKLTPAEAAFFTPEIMRELTLTAPSAMFMDGTLRIAAVDRPALAAFVDSKTTASSPQSFRTGTFASRFARNTVEQQQVEDAQSDVRFSRGVVPRPSYDTLLEWSDRDQEVRNSIVSEYLSGRYEVMPWKTVVAGALKRAWSEAARLGFVRDEKGLDRILDRLIENAQRLQFNNEVSGHEQYYPDSDLDSIREGYEDLSREEQAELRDKVSEWTNTPDGEWRISDYGLPKINEYLIAALGAADYNQKLMYMDMALNVIHQRSDLASWFVEGGSMTMSGVSGQGGTFARDPNPQAATNAATPAEVSKLTKAIQPLINKLAGIIGVEVVSNATQVPGLPAGSPAFKAVYANGKIYINAARVTSRLEAEQLILDHEIRHHGLRSILGDKLKTMMQQVWFNKNNAVKEFAKIWGIDTSTQQGRLEAAEEYVVSLAREAKRHPALDRIIAAVRGALRSLGFSINLSNAEIRAMVASAGKLSNMKPAVSMINSDVPMYALAAPAEQVATAKAGLNLLGKSMLEMVKSVSSSTMKWLAPVDRMIDMALSRPGFAPIAPVLKQLRNMYQDLQSMMDEPLIRAEKLLKQVTSTLKTREDLDRFNKIMELGTFWGIWPEKDITDQDWTQATWESEGKQALTGKTLEEALDELKAEFALLPSAEARQGYRDIIKNITESRELVRKEMLNFVKRTVPATDPNNPANYRTKADGTQELWGAREDAELTVNKKFQSIRGPYAPLSRFGDHVVHVYESQEAQASGEESRVARYHFEDYEKAQEFRRSMHDKPIAGNKRTVARYEMRSEAERTYGAIPSEFMAKMSTALEESGLEGEELAKMKDDMQRIWLQMSPEASHLKHTLTRTGMKGYNTDMLRGFLAYTQRNARSAAFLGRGMDIRNAFSDMRKQVTVHSNSGLGQNDPKKADAIAQDVQSMTQLLDMLQAHDKRVREEKVNTVVQNLSKIPFVWYLFSPSVLLVQSAQPFILTAPHLAARYGYKKAIAMVASMYKRQLAGEFKNEKMEAQGDLAREIYAMWAERDLIPKSDPEYARQQAVIDAKIATLNEADRMMLGMQMAAMRGGIDITSTHEAMAHITGDANSKTAMSGKWLMDKAGFFMQASEMASRKASFAAAYQLELAKSGDFEKATAVGIKALRDTLYDYSKSNRPAALQGNMGRLFGQFRIFQLHTVFKIAQLVQDSYLKKTADFIEQAKEENGITSYMIKDGVVSTVAGGTEEQQAAFKARVKEIYADQATARKELGFMLASTMMLSGAQGLPFLGTTLAALTFLGMLGGDDDEPWDAEAEFNKLIRSLPGGNIALKGLPALLGADVSKRVGMAGVFDVVNGQPPENLKGAQLYAWYASKATGPIGGVATDVLKSREAFMQGDWAGALSASAPKVVKDMAKAYQLALGDGYKTMSGKMILPSENTGVYDAVIMMMGINPMELSLAQENNARVSKVSTQVADRKSRLVRHMVEADSPDERDRAAEALGNFNSKMPMFAIKGSEIATAFKARIRKDNGEVGKQEMKIKNYLEG